MARAEMMVDRLAFALVISAFVMGFAVLLTRATLPWWMQAIAYYTLVFASGVGVWFFFSIIFRRFRQRHHD